MLISRKKLRSSKSNHNVEISEVCFFLFFWQIFRESNAFVLYSVKKYYQMRSCLELFRLINSLSTSLVKTVIWRRNVAFSVKILIAFYNIFPHCDVEEVSIELISRNFFPVKLETYLLVLHTKLRKINYLLLNDPS